MSFQVPGKILEEYTVRSNRLGLVEFGETCRPIILDLVPDCKIGDYVRVRVGFATELVAEDVALKEYEELAMTGELKSTETELQKDEAQVETVRRQKAR